MLGLVHHFSCVVNPVLCKHNLLTEMSLFLHARRVDTPTRFQQPCIGVKLIVQCLRFIFS